MVQHARLAVHELDRQPFAVALVSRYTRTGDVIE
jgi:hypothetical protein